MVVMIPIQMDDVVIYRDVDKQTYATSKGTMFNVTYMFRIDQCTPRWAAKRLHDAVERIENIHPTEQIIQCSMSWDASTESAWRFRVVTQEHAPDGR